MKEAVFHTTKVADRTTVASARVARYLSEKLGCPLYDGWVNQGSEAYHEHYDRVFYVNSMGAFAEPDFRLWLADQVRHCKQLIYVQNDYTIHPISQTQKVMRDERGWDHTFPFYKGPILWSTVKENLVKPQDSYVNWNALTYDPIDVNGPWDRTPGLVYWGSYRQDRKPSFDRYFGDVGYRVTLLCAPQVFSKFNQNHEPNTFVKGKPWKEVLELAQYEATVYVEDEKQHGEFHSLANRFYEALSAGLAIFIDKGAENLFEHSGLYVRDQWVVENAKDVEKLLPYAREIAADQRAHWANSFRERLDQQVARAYFKL